MAVKYVKVGPGGQLIPITGKEGEVIVKDSATKIVKPSMVTNLPKKPSVTVARGIEIYDIADYRSDFANGVNKFFTSLPETGLVGNYQRQGIGLDMDILGIRMILSNKRAMTTDEYDTYLALLNGYFTIHVGDSYTPYTAHNSLITPEIEICEVVSAAPTFSVVFKQKDYFWFQNTPGDIDWLAVSEKTSVYVTVNADASFLPQEIPTGFKVGIGLWVLPKKDVWIS